MYSNSSRDRNLFLFVLKCTLCEMSFCSTRGIKNVCSLCLSYFDLTSYRNFKADPAWCVGFLWWLGFIGYDSSSRFIFLKRMSVSLGPSAISRAYVRFILLFISKTSIWSRYLLSWISTFTSSFYATHLSCMTTKSSMISPNFIS